jgi:hypothetical protein
MDEKEKFQTAFPEDTEPQPEAINPFKVGEVLCQYGCGRPGQYFSHGPLGGELPRCSKQISDCPAMGGVATKAARRAGRLGGGRRRG